MKKVKLKDIPVGTEFTLAPNLYAPKLKKIEPEKGTNPPFNAEDVETGEKHCFGDPEIYIEENEK